MNNNPSSRRSFIKATALSSLAAGCTGIKAVAETGYDDEMLQPLVFLFQGDSITDGNRGRNTDPNHIMGHGYAFAVASRVGADFPQAGFVFYNRGISGNTIPDLQKRWQADTLDIKPDVLSILIGINDVAAVVEQRGNAHTVEEFEQGYRKLLNDSRQVKEAVLLVLGLPFVYPVGKRKDKWESWRTAVNERGAIVRKLATEYNAVLVDYPAVFDKAIQKAPAEYWIWDGIHPTVYGHELMARTWIKQVGRRLPFLHKRYRYGY